MTGGDFWDVVDPARSASLRDVGADCTAAVVLGVDGTTRLVLVNHDAVGDPAARYDPDCRDVTHEGCGPLPLAVVRKLCIAARHARESQDNANGERNSSDERT
jgi:hypothetical protein